jgi:hypothetical protein
MGAPDVWIVGDRAEVRFERFDLGAYERFLRIKRLPERQLRYVHAHRDGGFE